MARFANDIDITLLAFVSYLQHRLFLLEGKPPAKAERLTRRVVTLAYRMVFGEALSDKTHASIDRAVEHLVSAVGALEALIEEEEQTLEGGKPTTEN